MIIPGKSWAGVKTQTSLPYIFYITFKGFVVLQIDKVVQMYETMMTRHTTMIVGPTGGGKTVVLNTLCQAQTK